MKLERYFKTLAAVRVLVKGKWAITDAFVTFTAIALVALAPVSARQIDTAALTGTVQTFILIDAPVTLQLIALVAFAPITAGQIDTATTALIGQTLVDICNCIGEDSIN